MKNQHSQDKVNAQAFTLDRERATASLTVSDRQGNSHPVIAAKRIDSFRVLVVREWHGCQPFVVHTFNEQDGGFHHGHYCESLARAMAVFDMKAAGVIPYRKQVC